MDELTFDNEKYVSSKRAAQMTGYAKDYVGQLCREGRVKARLVGRNWYVLETSILEHRFGAEETASEPSPAEEKPTITWEAPKYVIEEPTVLPTLSVKPKIEPVEAAQHVFDPVVPEGKDTLAEMQSAWKEWFEKQEKALPDASEMLLADHEESPESEDATENREEEAEEEPVILHKNKEIEDEIDEEIEIPIARVRPQAIPIRSFRDEEPMDLRRTVYEEDDDSFVPAPVRMRSSRPKPKNESNYAARAFFVAVALIAITIAVIGSGVLDPAVDGSQSGSFLTDFLSGKQHITR